MDIIISHNNLDCDGFAALLAMVRLEPRAYPVLLGSLNRNVRDVLARYGPRLPFIKARELPKQPVTRVILVDMQELPSDEAFLARLQRHKPAIDIVDHHPPSDSLPPGAHLTQANTGAVTTILVEQMQERGLSLPPEEAMILLLGIYEDTGNLTYTTTTARDVRAAAWLLDMGASLKEVTEFVERPLTARQRDVYHDLQQAVRSEVINGHLIMFSTAKAGEYVEEISTLAHKLMDSHEPDALFVLVQMEGIVQIVARSRSADIDVAVILEPLGGGGHAVAAAALLRDSDLQSAQRALESSLRATLAASITAADIMTRELHAIGPAVTMAEAYQALQRYGHEALPIVESGRLRGLITRRDADKAMRHGLGGRPVMAFATFDTPTIAPALPLGAIQAKMKETDAGQLPVLEGERLIGIVTRTDVLRRWIGQPAGPNLAVRLEQALDPSILRLLRLSGEAAESMGFSLFLVGGVVRDLLLGLPNMDLDLVVEGDAIALAQRLADEHGGRTIAHERFGTAKWLIDETREPPLALDFVTARTEFYEYPAALPSVEAASLRQDLYRRDFTINTMAIALGGPRHGELVDFYGGKRDLDHRLIRVLHNLSFVEDATRILRAARLAERLDFTIEERTATLIPHAWDSLDRISGDRLRHEMNLMFREPEPERMLRRLADMDVLQHIYPGLRYSDWLAERYAAARRSLPQWQARGWGNGGRGGNERTAVNATYEGLLTYQLSPQEQQAVERRLNIGGETARILDDLRALRQDAAALAPGAPNSAIYKALHPHMIEALFILWLAEDAPWLCEAIVSYIDHLRHIEIEVDGATIQAIGVPPGPIYSRLLQRILEARLDGHVHNGREEADLLRDLLAEEGLQSRSQDL